MTWKPKQIYKGQNDLDTGVIITESRDDNNGKTMTFHYPWMDEQPVYTIQEEPVVEVQEEPKQESRRTVKDIKDGELTLPVTYMQEDRETPLDIYANVYKDLTKGTAKTGINLLSNGIDLFINKPIGFVMDNINDATNGGLYDILGNKYVQGGFSLITPSRWIGTFRTGHAPWDERNTGTGSYETDNVLDTAVSFLPFGGISKFKGRLLYNKVRPGEYVRQGDKLFMHAKNDKVVKSNDPSYHNRAFFMKNRFWAFDPLDETGRRIAQTPDHPFKDLIVGTDRNPNIRFRPLATDGTIVDKEALMQDVKQYEKYFKEHPNDLNYKYDVKGKYNGDIYKWLEDEYEGWRKMNMYTPVDVKTGEFAPYDLFAYYKLMNIPTFSIKSGFKYTPTYVNYGLLDNLKWGGAGITGVGLMGIGSNLPQYKKGSKIHIKKANRGKFTDYCGGTVTNECIQRGKNSSDPKIRKRATFAANARKWKKG